jgi:hypothetical protein
VNGCRVACTERCQRFELGVNNIARYDFGVAFVLMICDLEYSKYTSLPRMKTGVVLLYMTTALAACGVSISTFHKSLLKLGQKADYILISTKLIKTNKITHLQQQNQTVKQMLQAPRVMSPGKHSSRVVLWTLRDCVCVTNAVIKNLTCIPAIAKTTTSFICPWAFVVNKHIISRKLSLLTVRHTAVFAQKNS